jgi:hypothetical protein
MKHAVLSLLDATVGLTERNQTLLVKNHDMAFILTISKEPHALLMKWTPLRRPRLLVMTIASKDWEALRSHLTSLFLGWEVVENKLDLPVNFDGVVEEVEF